MNEIIDRILNLFDSENGQKVDKLREIFSEYEITVRKNDEKTTDKPTDENDYGALQRPEFRNYERD